MSRAHHFPEVTDNTGHASLLFKIKSNTKPGTYNILVNVSADGYDEPQVLSFWLFPYESQGISWSYPEPIEYHSVLFYSKTL